MRAPHRGHQAGRPFAQSQMIGSVHIINIEMHLRDGRGELFCCLVQHNQAVINLQAGMFLAFQYPVELPGVGGMAFLRAAVNARLREAGQDEVDQLEFVKMVRAEAKDLGIKDDMLKRAVNVGFSGGEKKRYEILQMALLKPSLAILDETDSGLDVDALKIVSEGVNTLRSAERGMLVITHYQRLLNHIVPDYVHILAGGRIVKSGDKSLALEVEQNGYAGLGDAA